MKNLKEYIFETKKVKHTLFPKNEVELEQMIKDEIRKNGIRCSLNHIDVSKVKSMRNLFNEGGGGIRFNGDISQWDVSKVKEVDGMFAHSEFNGDLSKWKLDSVQNIFHVFHKYALQKHHHNLHRQGKELPKLPKKYSSSGEVYYTFYYLSGED